MKYTFAALVLAAAVSAQSLSDIPACAVPCIDDARVKNTNCAASDYKCLCANINSLTTAATPCVISSCGADTAVNQVLPAVSAFCDKVKNGGGGTTASSSESAKPSSSSEAAPTTEATGYPTASVSASTPESAVHPSTVVSSPATGPSNSASYSSYPGSTWAPTVGGGNSTASTPATSVSVPASSQSGPVSSHSAPASSHSASASSVVSTVPTAGAAVAGSMGGLAMMALGALAAF
ncbi:hypothetical protein F4861DRAFT_374787 [Xylaria intraflava]|nr:hypothetical protein F4861DRAFT_374787 [Xylaria intraflava]